jgi:malic enzyme
VGTVCTDIEKNPSLLDKLTFRLRSVAVVTDGSLLDCEPKAFMPVMDWFVFQIKNLSGIDAYPFVLMKGADLSLTFTNLSNSYGAIIYLDGTVKDYKVPEDTVVINHRTIVSLAKSSLTDASFTSRALSYLLTNKKTGEPSIVDYETAINAPQIIIQKTFEKFTIDDTKSNDDNARVFHEHFQGSFLIIQERFTSKLPNSRSKS